MEQMSRRDVWVAILRMEYAKQTSWVFGVQSAPWGLYGFRQVSRSRESSPPLNLLAVPHPTV